VKTGHLDRMKKDVLERTEEDTASFADNKQNKRVGPQQNWSKKVAIKYCQSKEASILWSHYKEKTSCPEKEMMQGTMPGARR